MSTLPCAKHIKTRIYVFSPFVSEACNLERHPNLQKLNRIESEVRRHTGSMLEEQEMWCGEEKKGAFNDASLRLNGNKAKLLFVLLSRLLAGRVRGDICSGIPAHTPERLWRSSSEIERLINAPLTGLGLKINTQNNSTTVCAQVHRCQHKMLNVISTQPPVYTKGVDKHRMNSNKAHPQSTNTSSS